MQSITPRLLPTCFPHISRTLRPFSPTTSLFHSKTSHLTRTMSASKPQITPHFSPGSDTSILNAGLTTLLSPTGRWTLTTSGQGIQRLIRFKTFKNAWAFMDRVAQECKTAKHHPEWANTYNTVFVRWKTHSPKGLSQKDVTMALFCDEYAAELGEVFVEGNVSGNAEEAREGMIGLVDDLGEKAGDCCVPKKR